MTLKMYFSNASALKNKSTKNENSGIINQAQKIPGASRWNELQKCAKQLKKRQAWFKNYIFKIKLT